MDVRKYLIVPLLAGLFSVPAQSQLPDNAFLPMEHRLYPVVETLIRLGVLDDPSPLVRPYSLRELKTVLGGVDRENINGRYRDWLDLIENELSNRSGSSFGVGASLGAEASTTARRIGAPEGTLRPFGNGHIDPIGTFGGYFSAGGVSVVTGYVVDDNLNEDPDIGGSELTLPARPIDAYVRYRTDFFELFVGRTSRNWGPTSTPGLLVSNNPYPYDHLYLGVGPERLNLKMIVAQLDPMTDRNGEIADRFFIAHRLQARPVDFLEVSLWEGTIQAGPNRPLELWMLNPITIKVGVEDEIPVAINKLLGGDFQIALDDGTRIAASTALDDLQGFPLLSFLFTDSANDEPPSFAITAHASHPFGSMVLSLDYSIVSNLVYRTPNPAEAFLIGENIARGRPGSGLARSFSDYDLTSVRAEFLPLPGLSVQPELALLRQGEGDLRLPFPPASDNAITPTIFDGVTERTWRLALKSYFIHGSGLSADLDVGLHYIDNFGHVAGETDTRVEATFRMRYTIGGTGLLN